MRPNGELVQKLILAAALAWLAASGPAGAQDLRVAQPNAARFPEITLYSLPRDARGQPINGLDRERWRIREDGAAAEILDVRERGGHIEVCLAIDASLSMLEEAKMERAKAAAALFLRALQPEDRSALVLFGEESEVVRGLGHRHGALASMVRRVRAVGDGTVLLEGLYEAVNLVALQPETSLLGAPIARADARRVVLALSDGLDTGSMVVPDRLIAYARANGVSIITVALGRNAATEEMRVLSEATGGIALQAPSAGQLGQLYLALARQLRSEYRIRYRTPNTRQDARRREVEVAVDGLPRPAQTWYQAPGQGSLLVVAPRTTGETAGVTGQGESTAPPLNLLLLLLAAPLLIAGGVVFWAMRRARGNPRPAPAPQPGTAPSQLWVRPGLTRIGRAHGLEITLPSPSVSRLHAQVECLTTGCWISDAGSKNGTLLNGRRIRERRELRIGDLVTLGEHEFQFAGVIAGAGPTPAPSPQQPAQAPSPSRDDEPTLQWTPGKESIPPE